MLAHRTYKTLINHVELNKAIIVTTMCYIRVPPILI